MHSNALFKKGPIRALLISKTARVMQLTTLVLLGAFLQVSAAAFGQRVTITGNDLPLKQVFADIRQQTGYNFIYANEDLQQAAKVTLHVRREALRKVLDLCFAGQRLGYTINGNIIIVQPKTPPSPAPPVPPVTVKGRVVDSATGAPLGGVTIQVQGSTIGATTDNNGDFTLEAPDDAVLLVSYLGYNRQRIPLQGRSTLQIRMAATATGLNQLVVVGYGTQKKGNLTVAVSTISTEKLTERHAPNLTTALQGLAPGVTVWDQGGEPGASDASFNIRGITTLNQQNAPLVIVDGIEQSAYDINPNEIASVSVLKDAASTAIYGSRAANGVVLINTKRGHAGDLRVHYDGWIDFQNLATVPEHLDTRSYMNLQNVAYGNRGSNPLYSDEDIEHYVRGDDRLKYPLPNDWFNQVIRKNAPWQSHSLSVAGGSDKMNSLLSLRYMDQQGIYPSHDMQRYQLRLNNTFVLSSKLRAKADLKVRRQDRMRTNANDLYHRMIHSSQLAVPRYPDGTYGLSKQGYNLLALSDPDIVGSTQFTNDNGVINLELDWDILPGLRFHTQYGLDLDKNAALVRTPAYEIRDYYNPDVVLKKNDVNSLEERRSESLQKTWNNTLTYDRTLGRHDLSLLAGYSTIDYDAKGVNAGGRKFYNNDLLALGQSEATSREISSSYTDWGLRSLFGRVHYGYAQRYLLEFNMRYDGSSRFPRGHRYTFFPSVSGAWRLSEEAFWEPLKGRIEQLKLRASWGRNGNQNIALYTYFDNLNVGNYYNFNNVAVTGVLQQDLASQDLHWEMTTQTDLGLDMSMLDGKLSLTFDWYKKLTNGILLNLPIPGIMGLNPAATNAGKVQNTGWELQIIHRSAIGQVHYNLTLGLSDVHNKILDLAGTGPYFSQEKDRYIREVGQPIDALWGYQTDGLFTQEELDKGYPVLYPDTKAGDIKYVDRNSDGAITASDKTVLGSTIPRWTYSANMDLQWKGFDLNVFLQGVGSQDMMLWGAFIENGSWEGFTLAIGKDYWTEDNPDARFPRPQKSSNKNTEPSDYWVLNAGYLRLKNLQLGYTLPGSLTGKVGIQQVRFYVGGTNLLTFSGLNEWGMDAETPSGRDAIYPPLKTYSLGLNIGF